MQRKSLKENPEARLLAGLVALGLDPALSAPLLAYLGQLVRWNEAYNLTAIRDPAEMVTRHLLDSLAVLPLVHGRVIDVGSGAGVPGLPLAIANPALQVTVLDSNGKKARFLRHAQRTLALANVEVAEARAESHAPARPFDTVISRAFGSLAEFLEATGHLAAAGGTWVAMKGKLDAREAAAIPARFEIKETRRLSVPGLAEDRHAIVIAARAQAQ